VKVVGALLLEPGRRMKMAQAAHKFAHPEAAKEIADMAARLAGLKTVADEQGASRT
jgi:UDP-N-acetylglucosamine:LPS N-acetylglucosamine transferase